MLEILGMPNSSLGVPEGQPALTCLGIWPSKGCHASTCSGIRQSRGPRRSSHLDLPRNPILGMPSHLNLAGDSISRSLSCLSLPGDLHPDPGTPGSQVATVLCREIIRFSVTYLNHILSHNKYHAYISLQFSSVQFLSRVQLFATP